jgi:uncharacterized protein
MTLRKYQIKWSIIALVAFVVAILFIWESRHLKVETDILESMPKGDQVLSDARLIIKHLPIQDRLFIDVAQESGDRGKLIRAASVITDRLQKSGLFIKVGINDEAKYFPQLLTHITDNLPLLFSAHKLEDEIKPLLDSSRINEAFMQNRQSLEQLEGIGRSEMMARDPLGFSGIILKQLSSLMPAGKAQFYQGHLISEDGRHVLIIAKIAGSGTDTATAAKINVLLKDIEKSIQVDQSLKGEKYILSPVGAYRAALDNETMAKRDTHIALILTTIGIALLLLFAFPRPLIGLLALLPSTVGSIAALFVCSFFFPSMSMLAIGFGGAIMGFTVDLGITYLLFLDQTKETYGPQVAREVRSAEFLAVLTTVGSFLLLLISDFKILAEIGVFSALGVGFTLLFVLFVFPKIFPAMPPATRPSNPVLLNTIKKVAAPANWKLILCIIFGVVMLFFAYPRFDANINSMNSVSEDTINAENKLQETWGDFSGKCYIFLQAPSITELQKKNDQLQPLLADDIQKGKLTSAFLPTVLFPSAKTSKANLAAWQSFWSKQRLAKLQNDVSAAARANGFAPSAFVPFWKMINNKNPHSGEIPEKYFEFMGIAKDAIGYAQLTLLQTGKNYNADDFMFRLSHQGLAKIFDVGLFNKRLGDFLQNIFVQIALITAIGTIGIIFLFYLDWLLSLAVIAPITFALVSTLGTLKIIGHPLDIPSIMLWIIVMGMGVNYSIYYACFYQRYRDENHPAMDIVRLAMFLASFTTLIGFGVLAIAKHNLLRSIGLTSLLGIGYSIIGAYLILPTLMKKIYAPFEFPVGAITTGSKEHLRRAVLRYRHLEAYPRLFARFKIMIDPMFKELDRYVQNPRRIIDIGCGYGIPATWLLELYPEARVYGLEPDEGRVRIASQVIGDRGHVEVGLAPDLPTVDGEVDTVIMLDMLHLIDDGELQLVLQRIFQKLSLGGRLVIRATVPSGRKVPWKRWIEATRLKFTGMQERFRKENEIVGFMIAAGFAVEVSVSPTAGIEEKWFVGKR